MNTPYEYRAGFNLYYDKFDGSPDSTGVSDVLTFAILDSAVSLAPFVILIWVSVV